MILSLFELVVLAYLMSTYISPCRWYKFPLLLDRSPMLECSVPRRFPLVWSWMIPGWVLVTPSHIVPSVFHLPRCSGGKTTVYGCWSFLYCAGKSWLVGPVSPAKKTPEFLSIEATFLWSWRCNTRVTCSMMQYIYIYTYIHVWMIRCVSVFVQYIL